MHYILREANEYLVINECVASSFRSSMKLLHSDDFRCHLLLMF